MIDEFDWERIRTAPPSRKGYTLTFYATHTRFVPDDEAGLASTIWLLESHAKEARVEGRKLFHTDIQEAAELARSAEYYDAERSILEHRLELRRFDNGIDS